MGSSLPCVALSLGGWGVKIQIGRKLTVSRSSYGFLWHCVPFRWYCTIAGHFKQRGSMRRKSDICVCEIATPHVIDISIAPNRPCYPFLQSMMESFRHGGFSYLAMSSPVNLLGRRFDTFGPFFYHGLSHPAYRSHVPQLSYDQFFGSHVIYCTPKALLTAGNERLDQLYG